MSLSWGAYVALSVAILIFLVHDELETFSATSDTMQLVPTRYQLRAAVTRCGRCGLMLFPMTIPGTRTPPKDPRSVTLPLCTIHSRTVGQETVLINELARQLFVPAFKEGQTHPGVQRPLICITVAASQKLHGRTLSRSNMTGNCFLTLLLDQFVLTVVHPAQPLGPPHDASRGQLTPAGP